MLNLNPLGKKMEKKEEDKGILFIYNGQDCTHKPFQSNANT